MLEWRNHGVKWPSVTKNVDQLVSTILKRANEGSGIYQMFSHFGDVAIVDRYSTCTVHDLISPPLIHCKFCVLKKI